MNSGIYIIQNLINEKFYIGSTVNFRLRERKHFQELDQRKHGNAHLQGAFNKYGKAAFIFKVLKHVDTDLLAVEQAYLDVYWDGGKCCYNIAKDAKAPGRGRSFNHTSFTKTKMSFSKIGNTYGKGNKGHSWSLEQKEQMAKRLRGNTYALGNKLSEETKIKMSLAKKDKSLKIQCKQGHLYSEVGVYITPSTGRRQCKLCKKLKAAII